MKIPMIESRANFSVCDNYRYTLHRIWDRAKPVICFIGLNPSTADETNNDPTVTRCINRAYRWGYGGMVMLNIFAWRSTDPHKLYGVGDPVGTWNDLMIALEVCTNRNVCLCWGNHGEHMGRGQRMMAMLPCMVDSYGRPPTIYHLGMTKAGHPRHPLYLKSDAERELLVKPPSDTPGVASFDPLMTAPFDSTNYYTEVEPCTCTR